MLSPGRVGWVDIDFQVSDLETQVLEGEKARAVEGTGSSDMLSSPSGDPAPPLSPGLD